MDLLPKRVLLLELPLISMMQVTKLYLVHTGMMVEVLTKV